MLKEKYEDRLAGILFSIIDRLPHHKALPVSPIKFGYGSKQKSHKFLAYGHLALVFEDLLDDPANLHKFEEMFF